MVGSQCQTTADLLSQGHTTYPLAHSLTCSLLVRLRELGCRLTRLPDKRLELITQWFEACTMCLNEGNWMRSHSL